MVEKNLEGKLMLMFGPYFSSGNVALLKKSNLMC